MFDLFLGVVIGAFIGWHVPQPEWAKRIIDRLRG
jgi:hypothetical protein